MRKCSVCEKKMDEGFIVGDTEYYCSEECLHKEISDIEYTKLYAEGEAYYTTWEE